MKCGYAFARFSIIGFRFCTDPQSEFYNLIYVDNNVLHTLMSNTGMACFFTKSKVMCVQEVSFFQQPFAHGSYSIAVPDATSVVAFVMTETVCHLVALEQHVIAVNCTVIAVCQQQRQKQQQQQQQQRIESMPINYNIEYKIGTRAVHCSFSIVFHCFFPLRPITQHYISSISSFCFSYGFHVNVFTIRLSWTCDQNSRWIRHNAVAINVSRIL